MYQKHAIFIHFVNSHVIAGKPVTFNVLTVVSINFFRRRKHVLFNILAYDQPLLVNKDLIPIQRKYRAA